MTVPMSRPSITAPGLPPGGMGEEVPLEIQQRLAHRRDGGDMRGGRADAVGADGGIAGAAKDRWRGRRRRHRPRSWDRRRLPARQRRQPIERAGIQMRETEMRAPSCLASVPLPEAAVPSTAMVMEVIYSQKKVWARHMSRPAQWVEVEITIAAATPAPIAQMVSTKLVMIDTSVNLRRLTTQASDFVLQYFLLMSTSLIRSPPKRKTVRRATRTSAAVGFEPTPTPEGNRKVNLGVQGQHRNLFLSGQSWCMI